MGQVLGPHPHPLLLCGGSYGLNGLGSFLPTLPSSQASPSCPRTSGAPVLVGQAWSIPTCHHQAFLPSAGLPQGKLGCASLRASTADQHHAHRPLGAGHGVPGHTGGTEAKRSPMRPQGLQLWPAVLATVLLGSGPGMGRDATGLAAAGQGSRPVRCLARWAGRPILGPLQARPQRDEGHRDKHTRHHHTTSPEQEDATRRGGRFCGGDPGGQETRWYPGGTAIKDRMERRYQEIKPKHQYLSHLTHASYCCWG